MKCNNIIAKVIGVICVLTLLVGALYVPMSFVASAAKMPVEDDETVLFTFNEGEGSVTGQRDPNNITRGGDGIGCVGWGLSVSTTESRPERWEKLGFLHTNSNAAYPDNGGYRLNNNNGVYNVEPLTTYVVSFKLRVNSTPLNTATLKDPMKTSVKLGYGFTGSSSSDANTCSGMKTVVSDVFEAESVETKNEGLFTITTDMGKQTYAVGDTWYDLTYVFTTPANLGEGIPSLGFYSTNYYGTDYYIDDVSVTKVGGDKGVVVAIDEYSGEMLVLRGVKDSVAELPELTSDNAEHEFLGWYKDEGRTEAAEGITFADTIQTVYSAWDSPVSVTFIDTLNGGEPYVVSGVAGEEIVYPEDPLDMVEDSETLWFMGWYTTEQYTEEFVLEKFGYKNITVYSKWQEEYETPIEDFEDYISDARTENMESDGKKYSNRLYFGYAMDKIEDNGNNIIRFNWESDTVRDREVAGSYDAAVRYASLDHMIKMEDAVLLDGVTYTATFDYKVENISDTQSILVWPYNVHPFDVWTGGELFKNTQNAFITVDASKKSDEWQKGEFTFTMHYADETKTGLFIMISLSENSDATLYFDNFEFIPVQPYESAVTYYPNNGEPPRTEKGKRGEDIPPYFPENNGLRFLGWYYDAECTVPFEETKFGRLSAGLYAKWAGVAFEFNNYTAAGNTNAFAAQSLIIDKSEGAGYADNAAVRWHYKGDKLWKVENGLNVLFCDRSNIMDHKVFLGPVENHTTYEISYYVKTTQANSSYTVRFATAKASGVWDGGFKAYSGSVCYIDDEVTDGWVKKTTIITTDFGDQDASSLYALFAADKSAKDTEIIASIDRVIVTEVKDIVVFNSNAEIDGAYQIGYKGDVINFPTFVNGKAEFLGWYSDEACEIPFTETIMPEGITNVYAKWSALPIAFDKYKLASADRFCFGVSMSIKEEAGIGMDDNFVLRWHIDPEMVRNVNPDGSVYYMRERAKSTRDNMARLGFLTNNTAYKITYYYKAAENSNCDAKISFATGHELSIWESNYVMYDYTEHNVPLKQTEWTKVETYLVTDFGDKNGNMLYMQFVADCENIPNNINVTVLVDNVLIEKVDKPYVVFDGLNDSSIEIVKGKAGEKITFPTNPVRVGFDFIGWFADKEATVPFEPTVFKAGESHIAYAGYKRSNKVLYNFDKYDFKPNPGWNQMGNGLSVEKTDATLSGEYAIKVDRHNVDANQRVGHLILGHGSDNYVLDPGKKYVVTFNYYVVERGTSELMFNFRTAHFKSAFANAAQVTDSYTVNTVVPTGVWKTKALIIDTKKMDVEGEGTSLYICVEKGQDFVLYIDNVEIEALPENYTAYVIDNAESKNVPQYVAGKIGTSFANKLPKSPTKDNHVFLGYVMFDENMNSEELTADKMIFTEEKMSIKANFVRLKTTQNFDDEFNQMFVYYVDFGTMDFDYEHYDSQKEGNSKDNVTSGRYSLHRKGTTYHLENAQIFSQNQMLTAGQRYTVTMKVKLGKYLQTDGAIKVASNRAVNYPWAVSGDYYPVVAIKDLLDGEWHEVSYTFNAIECYFSIQTPGYCELFIDDVVLTRVTKDTPLSDPVEYTEYVPAKRDADGNLIGLSAFNKDVSSIVDASIYVKSVDILPYIIIGSVAVVVIAAGVVVLLIVLKKRKNKKA